MKHLPLFLVLIALPALVQGQNLVPNPSVETCAPCPNGGGQINYATGWSSYAASPDYYHGCGTSNFGSPGPNLAGTQVAAHGTAYFASVIKYSTSYYREHGGVMLSSPLIVGQAYDCVMKVNLTDISQYGGNKMGFLFSTTPSSTVSNFAHVYTNAVLTDKNNWITVSGTFVATQPYQYMAVGNFFDDANTTITPVAGGWYAGAYVNFDSFSVRTVILAPNQVTLHLLDKEDGKVALGWSSQDGHEITSFQLERSMATADEFEPIKTLDVHAEKEYRYVDAPGRYHVPVVYRVRAFDRAGNTHLSNAVEAVLEPSDRLAIDVYPNPVLAGNAATVRFQALGNQDHRLELMDLAGRVLHQTAVPASEASAGTALSTQGLAAGSYLLRVSTEGKQETQTLRVLE